ncbi:hypothetical protein FOL46_001261 [Perkinsus olseni]|uniref:Sorl1p n=1 Tax=Perkinsus olseni TaxID=32597 RepID=A0A7J6MDL3_PEROL|nr:hypothetical protein FOL46_001261 [Perkinsus olseni]
MLFTTIYTIAIIFSHFVSVQAESCSQLCSTIESCDASQYGSYCKGWTQGKTICQGILTKSDGSVCYDDNSDESCFGKPVECKYDDYGLDEVVWRSVESTVTEKPSTAPIKDEVEPRTSPKRKYPVATSTDEIDASTPSSSATRRRLTMISAVAGDGEDVVWPSHDKVPKPVSTADDSYRRHLHVVESMRARLARDHAAE